ncbi:Na+ dependent nucleoside transporter [Ditylenchus destructor]|nr:Na+ dependent nucleoside transporter [Ditylenchus destructor]
MGANGSIDETFRVAQLMGTKTALNEFIAYKQLGKMVDHNLLSPRSAMIVFSSEKYNRRMLYVAFRISHQSAFNSAFSAAWRHLEKESFHNWHLGSPLFFILNLSLYNFRALLAGCISCFFTASLAGVLVETPIACRARSTSSYAEKCFNISFYQRIVESDFFRISRLALNNSASSSPFRHSQLGRSEL